MAYSGDLQAVAERVEAKCSTCAFFNDKKPPCHLGGEKGYYGDGETCPEWDCSLDTYLEEREKLPPELREY